MSLDTLLSVGICVFTLLLVGLFLTYREFKYGQPKKDSMKNALISEPK